MSIDYAVAAERNLLRAVAIWAGAAEEGQLDERDGCTFARCAAELRSFNQVIVTRPPDDLGAILGETREYFRGVGGRFRLRVREDVEPVPDQPFIAGGLVRDGGIPSLSAVASSARDTTSIEIRPVVDEETLDQHIDIVAASFDMWREELARVFRPGLLTAAGWHAFVGYLDGEAVVTTQVVIDGDVAGLYWVGTTGDARGRGFGEAMTRHAMGFAAGLGCTTVTLQASPLGLPVYERIGFENVAYYRTFVAGRT